MFAKIIRNMALAFPLLSLVVPVSDIALAETTHNNAPAIVKKAGKNHKTTKNYTAIEIQDSWARAMPLGAKVGAGYFSIKNNSAEPLRLASIRSDVAKKVEIHSMMMKGDIMQMRQLKEGIEIPPHSGLSFKPGSYHIMFINPKMPFKAGEKFKARFIFSNGTEAEVPFVVRSAVMRK